jgi:hypothetical protein
MLQSDLNTIGFPVVLLWSNTAELLFPEISIFSARFHDADGECGVCLGFGLAYGELIKATGLNIEQSPAGFRGFSVSGDDGGSSSVELWKFWEFR